MKRHAQAGAILLAGRALFWLLRGIFRDPPLLEARQGLVVEENRPGSTPPAPACCRALVFMGSLHAYVFLNRILKIADPPIPLDTYLDTLLEVWSRGAILEPKRKPGP